MNDTQEPMYPVEMACCGITLATRAEVLHHACDGVSYTFMGTQALPRRSRGMTLAEAYESIGGRAACPYWTVDSRRVTSRTGAQYFLVAVRNDVGHVWALYVLPGA